MKALVVAPYYAPQLGGLENYARELSKALASQAHWEVVIVTSRKGFQSSRETIDNFPIYRLGTWITFSNTPLSPLWLFSIRSIIRREKPDVIIAHTPVPSLADVTALVKGSTPMVLIDHAATLVKQHAPLFNILVRLYGVIGEATFRRANRVFAVSDFVLQQLPPDIQAKTIVVPNAVWSDSIASHSQLRQAKFIFIALLKRSHAWKGLGNILDALALYRERYGQDFELTVIGDGDMRPTYEAQARRLGIQSYVRFVGPISGTQKLELVRDSTLMILYPTTENDAFPTVMLEAWSQSVPVVAARIGALSSLIEDGVDGFLCEARQPSLLADKMHQVMSLSPTERDKIARAATKRTQASYTWEHQAKLVDKELRALL